MTECDAETSSKFKEGGTKLYLMEDVYLTYLPLAHIMEMVAECASIGVGASTGFGNLLTLLSAGDTAKKFRQSSCRASKWYCGFVFYTNFG